MSDRICISALLIFCFASGISAQSRYRTEVFGSAGVSDYVVIFGPSLRAVNFGAGIGYRPFSADRSAFLRMLGLEFEANATRASTRYGTATQTYFTGNLVLHASLRRAEPYLLMGVGASHEGDTHRAGNVGVGAKIFITPHVFVRPELRVFGTEYLGNFVRESVGVGYHW